MAHSSLCENTDEMEVDSVHATIEKKIKGVEIHTPSDYVKLMKEARINPKPYDVEYLSHGFFSNYKDFGTLKSIKPGKRVGDANVTDIRALKYCLDGTIQYKLQYKDDWTSLPLPRQDKIQEGNPKQMYTARLKIKKSKFDHLQSMKNVILSDAHSFYDALPH
ncbi:hypothetical protein PoB_006885600 [Plakobranchus ocellatus]|uniref:Uncharacterized protein n=1 Tax=Plakobranchus ocellatus TaxID=259542 RepID=A0AAV4DE05_9GAST|nr:hypothetical protein PoB_006885600 [Plakobranchus ocellatus]